MRSTTSRPHRRAGPSDRQRPFLGDVPPQIVAVHMLHDEKVNVADTIGIEGGDIPLGASVSLFMVPILTVAAIFILRDISRRGNEA